MGYVLVNPCHTYHDKTQNVQTPLNTGLAPKIQQSVGSTEEVNTHAHTKKARTLCTAQQQRSSTKQKHATAHPKQQTRLIILRDGALQVRLQGHLERRTPQQRRSAGGIRLLPPHLMLLIRQLPQLVAKVAAAGRPRPRPPSAQLWATRRRIV